MKNKKAAMEMSVGTIVTIVLLMSVLVLGLFLVKNIFSSAKGAVDVVDDQLIDQVNKMFGDDSRSGIYPTNRFLSIKQESTDQIGLVIRNLKESSGTSAEFTYEVFVDDGSDCGGISDEVLMKFIKLGKSGSATIPSGDSVVKRISLDIPIGSPLCTIRYGVEIESDGIPYASEDFDIEIKAK